MDITVQKAISASRTFEQQLSSQLVVSNVSYAQLEETLKDICQACSTALLQDVESASAQHAESRLWDSHQKVNSYYRAELQKLKKSPEINTVARRKLENSYLRFIKTAQRFYRGYIHNLAAAYGGIPELERIARKVPYDGKAKFVQTARKVDPSNILASCYHTLIHLGDLSRYRETELAEKEKDWRPAVGFYDLAITVLPTSGISYNQLAVIALADGNLFRATYQLYRALSTEDPHPQAEANLRKAFFKVTAAWKAGELKSNVGMTAGAGLPSPMVAWYLRLLSMCYHGKPFVERDQIEDEVVGQLEVDLIKQPTEIAPHRLVKINIAAGYAAQERLVKAEGNTEDLMQSYLFFLRLNIRTLLILIRVFQSELDRLELDKSSAANIDTKILCKRVTPLMQRVLPVLRLYCLWVRKNATVLAKGLDATFSTLQRDVWVAYAKCLSSVIQAFPSEHLTTVEYLLEEDEDTIGFKPLHCPENQDAWFVNGLVMPRWYEIPGQNRDVSAEMLSRITGVVVVGLKLALDENIPLTLQPETCTFQYELKSSQDAQENHIPDGLQTAADVTTFDHQAFAGLQDISGNGVAEDDSFKADVEAQRMVDNIVGLEDMSVDVASSNGLIMLSPAMTSGRSGAGSSSPFPVGTHTANDLIEAVRGYSQTNRKPNGPLSVPSFPGLGVYSSGLPGTPSPVTAPQSYGSPGLVAVVPGWNLETQAVMNPRIDTALRVSPLGPPPGLSNHMRINSHDSTDSVHIAEGTWSSFQPTEAIGSAGIRPKRRSLYNDRGLGNGTFGDLMFRRESYHDSRGGSLMGSPSLVTTKNDPWGKTNDTFATAQSVSHSPTVAQWQSPAWNPPTVGWSISPVATTNSRSVSRDFNYTRPVT